MEAPDVLLVPSGPVDHFPGLEAALEREGVSVERAWPEPLPPVVPDGVRAVVVHELESARSVRALRLARRVGAATVLLLDGIVEWRNLFVNGRNAADMFAPAPVDVVLCCGEVDRAALVALGNDARATGLPRLAWARNVAPPPRTGPVLVATARTPWFTPRERAALLDALEGIAGAAQERGVEVVWRLTGDLGEALGVACDTSELHEALGGCCAVLTTPSTLAVEAMLAGRPTGLVHPWEAPLWPAAGLVLGRAQAGTGVACDAVAQVKARAGCAPVVVQDPAEALSALSTGCVDPAVLGVMWAGDGAAERAAKEITQVIRRGVRARVVVPLPPTRVLPGPRPGTGRVRVVSCVYSETTPVGGVATWSERLAAGLAGSGVEVRTLHVVTGPHALPAGLRHGNASVCRVDPTDDPVRQIDTVRAAIERLEPDVVLPNYCDLCYAAAVQVHAAGVRMVAVAHTDDASYRDLIATYDVWDAAVGVSSACMAWLEPMARGRPVERIVYGVPVSGAPRDPSPDGPLELAYIGRMTEQQKRISDLISLCERLEALGVDFRLHVVGDGPDLDRWRQRAGAALRAGRAIVHGRRDPAWVQRFLARVDVSVLVSEFEGTSITMLEAMGAGVVPAVTRVSGVNDWIEHGREGVVVEVGEVDAMAEHLADLSCNRHRLAQMGRAAWERVRSARLMETMCASYARVFREALSRPAPHRPTDACLRLADRWRCAKTWADEPVRSAQRAYRVLRESGFSRVAWGEPCPGADAVITTAHRADPQAVARWRSAGLGVVVLPHLMDAAPTEALRAGLDRARTLGSRRVAVFGTGLHTARAAPVLADRPEVVGFLDDRPPPGGRYLGRPVVKADEALERLAPDAVVLSSDAWERALWERAAPLRAAGVRVIALYGSYEEAA